MRISHIPQLLAVGALGIAVLPSSCDVLKRALDSGQSSVSHFSGVIGKVTKNTNTILTIMTNKDGKIVCVKGLEHFPKNTTTVILHSGSYEASKGFGSLRIGDKVRIIESADHGYLQVDGNKETLFRQSPQKGIKVEARKFTQVEENLLLNECKGNG